MSGGVKPNVKVGDVFYNKSGTCVVTEYRGANDIIVQFENGHAVKCSSKQLKLGTLQNPASFLQSGDVFESTFQKWVVVEYIDAFNVVVKCIEDGYITTVRSCEVKRGHVRNPYHKRIAGVGYFGSGNFELKDHYWAYQKWAGMLHRCYDPTRYAWCNYGGRGVVVEDCWHNFQNFAEWAVQQPFYGVKGYEIDKDLLSAGVLPTYSRESCCFIPAALNSFLSEKSSKSDLPLGVAKTSNKGKPYRARLSKFGKLVNIGVYKTVQDASDAYASERQVYLVEILKFYHGKVSEQAFEALKEIS